VSGEAAYVSRVRVEPVRGPLRRVWLPAEDEPVVIGSHGPLAAHYGYPTEPPYARASAIDYLVASVTACLSGTLAGALRARGIDVGEGVLVTEAAADVGPEEDGVLVVRRIEVRHRLRLASEDRRAAAERAHDVHGRACAVHRSIGAAVPTTTRLEIEVAAPERD